MKLAPVALIVMALLLLGSTGLRAQTATDCPPSAQAPSAEQMQGLMRDAKDRGFLWRITREGRSSWLYGTIHVARLAWTVPGPTITRALLQSSTLALELDPLDPDIQRRMAQAMAQRRDTPLPAALAARLRTQLLAECLAPEALAGMAPELQVATLGLMVARRDGFDPAYGIDVSLAGFARAAGKTTVSLETPELQLKVLQGADPAETIEFVDSGLVEVESGRARPLLRHMAAIWAASNQPELASYTEWCNCIHSDADRRMFKRLLDDRNPGLADSIDRLHRSGKTVFAAVGALHMIGPLGLPRLLTQRGYQVEPVGFGAEPAGVDIRALWDFSDPAGSEARFRERLAGASGDDALSLQTQIARTFGLRSRFDDAFALLDRIEPQLKEAGAEPKVRHALERGRTLRSSKQPEKARPLFIQAVEMAAAAKLDELGVDAMHMVALVETAPAEQLRWNQRALALAERSSDPNARNWDAALANNIGMSLHDEGRFDAALASFNSALAARQRIGKADRIREARWMVAWALRSLKRHDEALAMLRKLEAEFGQIGQPDGFVFEELGENLLALGRATEARPNFARAWELLSKDESLDRPDDARLARLKQLGE